MFSNEQLSTIRADFPVLSQAMNGDKPLAYLDNAASTQKPTPVLDAQRRFLDTSYANIHRGVYQLSVAATAAYDRARHTVAQFIHAKYDTEIVFTRNATEAANLVSYGFARKYLHPGDEIVLTELEHHGNLIPWQQACIATGARIVAVPVGADGTIDPQKVIAKFTPRTKLLAISGCSNVFGSMTELKPIIAEAKAQRIQVLVDAAQLVPHHPVDVQLLECDFLIASGHKMLAPSGIGFLYARREWMALMDPMMFGGDMINEVWIDRATWAEIPSKFEAGTPNIEGAIALAEAVKYLQQIGLANIHEHCHTLALDAAQKLSQLEGVTVYGNYNRSGIVSFTCGNVHPHDLASLLDQDGVAIRAGHHCAQPLMRKLGITATARASFYLYNTPDEVNQLVASVDRAINFFNGLKK